MKVRGIISQLGPAGGAMKRTVLASLILCALLVMSFPLVAHGADYGGKIRKANYFAVKGGIFSPRADLDDLNLEDGYAINFSVGHYFSDRFVVEFGTEILQADGDLNGVSRDILILPVTATAKYIVPTGVGDFYLGAGAGVYFARLEQTIGGVTSREHDVVLGGHILGGANLDITDDVFVGIEGKWMLTDTAKFFGQELTLSGATLTGHAGMRF